MGNDRLKLYHMMVVDFWENFLSHSNPNDTDAYWKEFLDAIHSLYEKHKGTDEKLARDLGVAFYSVMQRMQLERRNHEGQGTD